MLEELDIPDFFLGRSRIRVIYPGCIEVAGNVTLQLIKFLQFASARRAHITLPSYIVYLLRGSANFMSSLVIQKILSGFYYTVDLLFRPLDFGLSIDSWFHKPVTAYSTWFTFGMLLVLIVVILFLLLARNSILEAVQNIKQIISVVEFFNIVWGKIQKTLNTLYLTVINFFKKS